MNICGSEAGVEKLQLFYHHLWRNSDKAANFSHLILLLQTKLWTGNSLDYRTGTHLLQVQQGQGRLHTQTHKKVPKYHYTESYKPYSPLQYFCENMCGSTVSSGSWGFSLGTVWRRCQRDPCCPSPGARRTPLARRPGCNHHIHQSLLTPWAPC